MCVSLSQSVASGTVEMDNLVGILAGVISTKEAWFSRHCFSIVQDPDGLVRAEPASRGFFATSFGEPDMKGWHGRTRMEDEEFVEIMVNVVMEFGQATIR